MGWVRLFEIFLNNSYIRLIILPKFAGPDIQHYRLLKLSLCYHQKISTQIKESRFGKKFLKFFPHKLIKSAFSLLNVYSH